MLGETLSLEEPEPSDEDLDEVGDPEDLADLEDFDEEFDDILVDDDG